NETVEVIGGPVTVNRPAKAESNAQLKQAEAKFSSELLAIYRCAVSRRVNTAGHACKPAPARLKLVVDLSDSSSTVEQKLLRAGFKVTSGSGTKQLTGTIAPAQLAKLAQIAEVKSVSLSK
ncbi:MAG TPA: hypothetical protein VJW55_13730, partial [Candidatus Angelobacter sp.]|nr:hypothetical protein [Candidatus Angelobacter sp.]